MAQFSIFGVKIAAAETHAMSGGIKIVLADQYHWHGDSQVLIFSDDAILSERLAEAINRLVAERAAETQPETEVVAA